MRKPSLAFHLSRFVATSASRVPGAQVHIPKTAFRIYPNRSRIIINDHPKIVCTEKFASRCPRKAIDAAWHGWVKMVSDAEQNS